MAGGHEAHCSDRACVTAHARRLHSISCQSYHCLQKEATQHIIPITLVPPLVPIGAMSLAAPGAALEQSVRRAMWHPSMSIRSGIISAKSNVASCREQQHWHDRHEKPCGILQWAAAMAWQAMWRVATSSHRKTQIYHNRLAELNKKLGNCSTEPAESYHCSYSKRKIRMRWNRIMRMAICFIGILEAALQSNLPTWLPGYELLGSREGSLWCCFSLWYFLY